MKKIRFFLAAIVILFLAVGNSNAQKKTTFTDSYPFEDIMVCTDDYVWGVETVVVTNWQSKTQTRWKGEYEGASGKHYTWSMVVNDNWKSLMEGHAAHRTYVSTSVIECEGEPIAIYKMRYHITVNANGEISIERYWDSGDGWVCL